MRAAFIIPTGIGCKYGGHAGDATPALKLIAEVCDEVITHPNVVNASDINEIPSNCLYVEGSMLNQHLDGWLLLDRRYPSNKILVAVNHPVRPETINAVNTARVILGANIEILELHHPLIMEACFNGDGTAGGSVKNVDELISQVHGYEFDALAIATAIEYGESLKYFREGGVNPWGKVEAMVSGKVSKVLHKPCAHAPTMELDTDEIKYFNEVVDPRIAAEVLSMAFLHCVLKGLHTAPRLWTAAQQEPPEVDVLVSPMCFGPPHKICEGRGILIIYVKDNTTVQEFSGRTGIFVENYLEAAGVVVAMKAGLTLESVRRPFGPVIIHGADPMSRDQIPPDRPDGLGKEVG